MKCKHKILLILSHTFIILGIAFLMLAIIFGISYIQHARLHEPDVEMNGTVHFQELHLAKNCGAVTCHYRFGKDVRLGNAAISGNIRIGDNTSLGKDTELYGNIKIGKNVVIQSHVYMNGREYYKDNGIWHLNMDKATIHNITIPDGAWIPTGSKIRNQEDTDKAMIL